MYYNKSTDKTLPTQLGLFHDINDSKITQEHIPLRTKEGIMTCSVSSNPYDRHVANVGYVKNTVKNSETTTKQYVDDLIKSLTDRITELEERLTTFEEDGIVLNVGITDDGEGNVTIVSDPNANTAIVDETLAAQEEVVGGN